MWKCGWQSCAYHYRDFIVECGICYMHIHNSIQSVDVTWGSTVIRGNGATEGEKTKLFCYRKNWLHHPLAFPPPPPPFPLKVPQVFDSGLSHKLVSPKPLSIPIGGLFNFFRNLWKSSQFKVHHQWRWHRWQMKESQIRKVLIILFWHQLTDR